MRLLPAFALSASLALGACQTPDGQTDWGSTAALGIGAAALVGLVAVAANNNNHNDRYYQQPRYRGYPRYADRGRGNYRRW